eukprot:TRINITY_DN27888_c0_g1_i4.p1 TRINITY_DN27888_c0_g1~~TRINITY_DN27888_c0_g1_i4.p1  ORF type:complete len:291 (+),score=47.93 TRINITY_DN27888_c0_g1_i4:123-995(+)
MWRSAALLLVHATVSLASEKELVKEFDEQREAFERDGYLILRGLLSAEEVQVCRSYLSQRIWAANPKNRPYSEDVQIEVTEPGVWKGGYMRRTLQRTPPWVRNKTYRLINPQLLPLPNPFGLVPVLPHVVQIVRSLMTVPPRSLSSLLFERGTQQDLHEDTWYGLGGMEFGGMVAIWFAFDDVDEENGPLLYVPGSHLSRQEPNHTEDDRRWRRMTLRDDASRDSAYSDARLHLQAAKTFHGKAGDAFVWHERLLHGGAPVADFQRTRLSMVVHYHDSTEGRLATEWNLS